MKFIETTNQAWSVARVYAAMSEAELNELEASGQAVDNVQWYWGRKVGERIAAGVPAMYAYAAIAKKVGRGKSTIAQCYYTWKTFSQSEPDQRVPYSVYNHARQWAQPDEVVEYYLDHACSVDEIEAVFRVGEIEDNAAFEKSDLPSFLVGAWREMRGLSVEKYNRAYGYLQSFLQEIGWKQ